MADILQAIDNKQWKHNQDFNNITIYRTPDKRTLRTIVHLDFYHNQSYAILSQLIDTGWVELYDIPYALMAGVKNRLDWELDEKKLCEMTIVLLNLE